MDFLLFMIFSFLEAFAFFCFMLKCYRFHLKPNLVYISVVSLLLPYASYLVRNQFDLGVFDPCIQFGLMVLFLWFIFKVHPFYAFIMSASTFFSYVVCQSLLVMLLMLLDSYQLSSAISGLTKEAYLVQGLSTLGLFWVTRLFHKRKIGFIFVPHEWKWKPNSRVQGIDLRLLLICLFSLLLFFLAFFLVLEKHDLFFMAANVLMFLCLGAMIYYLYKKERSNALKRFGKNRLMDL